MNTELKKPVHAMAMSMDDKIMYEESRADDWRSSYSRDKARIIHGSSFRRLQGKTQVMGAGENDFHRTRLTHSLEVAQIGLGLFGGLFKRKSIPNELSPYAVHGRPVISAACYAHDLGHPPYGHGGEVALHKEMKEHGGFEGNAHTVRLLVKLEKYKKYKGINPTRRVLLSVLKYPVAFSDYPEEQQKENKPPKCYFDTEKEVIDWALSIFTEEDRQEFVKLFLDKRGTWKPKHKTFDASVMECGDDIAYCAHDLEDIVARRLVRKSEMLEKVKCFFEAHGGRVGTKTNFVSVDDFNKLFVDSYERKDTIGKIINMLMTNTQIQSYSCFEHPLLRYRLEIKQELQSFADFLKRDLTYGMVVEKPEVQMLERKGQQLICKLYRELKESPRELIPHWDELDTRDTEERRICDYIAGMTDSFAAKIYHRLFTPGIGSSRDEL